MAALVDMLLLDTTPLDSVVTPVLEIVMAPLTLTAVGTADADPMRMLALDKLANLLNDILALLAILASEIKDHEGFVPSLKRTLLAEPDMASLVLEEAPR